MRRAIALGGVAAAVSMVVAGISAATPAMASGPTNGGTAVIGLASQTSPNWFFPAESVQTELSVNSMVNSMDYLPLVYFGPNNTLSTFNGLASKVSYNKSGTVYTVYINPKWHWSDGRPVTAQDVVFTYNIMKAGSNPKANYAWSYGGQGSGGMPQDWKSVVAKNAHTVVITTTKPVNQQWFIRNGIGQIIPVPSFIWNKYPTNIAKEMKFIQSISNSPGNKAYQVVDGPWVFQSMAPNQNWTYVKNSRYDGPKAHLNKVIFQYETSNAAEFEALRNGTLNYGYLPASMVNDKSELPNDRIVPQYNLNFNYIQINMGFHAPGNIGKAFRELAVRQALQMGVDEQGIIKTIWHGYGALDDTVLGQKPSNVFVDPKLSKLLYPFNPAQGKKILEKAGWRMKNGVMTKNGVKLEFNFYCASGDTSYDNIDQLLQQDWKKEGIIAKIVYQPFNTVASYSASDGNKWQVLNWNGGWGYSSAYPSGGLLFSTGAAMNAAAYSSKKMDQLINATYAPASPQKAIQNMYAYEAYAAQQLPGVIYLPEQPTLTVVAKNLHNALKTFNPIGGWIFPNVWWISK